MLVKSFYDIFSNRQGSVNMKALLLAVALVILAIGNALAQAYPSRPITLVVPVAAGGSVDTIARLLSERIKAQLGQPVIVENVTGAGGSIGVARAARAVPDGYSLSIGNWTTHVGASAVYRVSYDVLKDFEPVSRLTDTSMLIVGRNGLPAKDIEELIVWLKANPDKASAATIGIGSPAHLCGIDFQNKTGTRFGFVPYRGGAPAIQDLVAGQVDLFCGEASNILPHVRSGTIRAYAVASKSRWFAAPDIVTTIEAGVHGMDIPFWHGIWAPKGTPKEVVALLHAAVADAFAEPALRQRLAELGHEIPSAQQRTPAAFGAFHKAEIDKWWPIIRAAGIKAE